MMMVFLLPPALLQALLSGIKSTPPATAAGGMRPFATASSNLGGPPQPERSQASASGGSNFQVSL